MLSMGNSKAAHSDLLGAIPDGSKPINSLQDKIDLVTPFVHIGYDPSYVADPRVSHHLPPPRCCTGIIHGVTNDDG